MEPNIQNIKALFKEEVDKKISVDELDPNLPLMDQGVDSLDRSSIFLRLEDDFGVTISDDQMEELTSINKIIEFLKSQ